MILCPMYVKKQMCQMGKLDFLVLSATIWNCSILKKLKFIFTCHGESDPSMCVNTSLEIFNTQERHLNRFKNMVYDVACLEYEMDHDQEMDDSLEWMSLQI